MIAAYTAALALTVVTSLGLALLLGRHAGPVPGGRPLALFIAGVGVFACGPLLLALFGRDAAGVALALFGFVAVPSALYLHFVVRFTAVAGRRLPSWLTASGYAAAGMVTVAGYALGIGHVEPWRDFDAAFVPGWGGWVAIAVGVVISVIAHLNLALALRTAAPLQRRQITLVLAAAVWGLLSCSGLIFPVLRLDLDPWPVLLLPVYAAALTFGVLRHRLMAVNVWAQRTLTWAFLVLVLGCGLAGAGALTAALGLVGPLGLTPVQLWAILAVVLLAALLLAGPLRDLTDRLVFPGGRVDPALAARWRQRLAAARDWPELAAAARDLLRTQFREPIAVTVAPRPPVTRTDAPDPAGPALICGLIGETWHCDLTRWDEAPPGPRQAALIFAGVLRDAAERLHQARRLAAEAETRRRQAHLAELGQLAATVAHDLRNPLNTIAMAAAGTAPAIRSEIRIQLGRMDTLIADLLDYAGAWKVQPVRAALAEIVEAAALGVPDLELDIAIGPDVTVLADLHRLRRVFANVLTNARAAARPAPARAEVRAEWLADGGMRIRVSDAGAGVPAGIRDSLFKPFVSSSAEGTGLGLAIVARIIEAHGGTAALAAPSAGWTTCIELTLPAAPAPPEAAHA